MDTQCQFSDISNHQVKLANIKLHGVHINKVSIRQLFFYLLPPTHISLFTHICADSGYGIRMSGVRVGAKNSPLTHVYGRIIDVEQFLTTHLNTHTYI